jgi:hypothetical protein
MMRRLMGGLWLILASGVLVAQTPDVQMGTVEKLDQDNGSLTISGKLLPYSDAVTEVYLEGQRIGAEKIDLGMVVRYTLDTTGTLLRVELIGPSDKLAELQQH